MGRGHDPRPTAAADDAVRPAYQPFGVASDVGGRLGSCDKSSTSIVAVIVNQPLHSALSADLDP